MLLNKSASSRDFYLLDSIYLTFIYLSFRLFGWELVDQKIDRLFGWELVDQKIDRLFGWELADQKIDRLFGQGERTKMRYISIDKN